MTYGLQLFKGESPNEELIFDTRFGDTFLKKIHKVAFGPSPATNPIVLNNIPSELNRDNSVICVSVTHANTTIVGNARAIFTGVGVGGAGQITIARAADSGTIEGFVEVLQFEDMQPGGGDFGLFVSNPEGDLIIDHNTTCWGVQYGGTLEDQGWFGYPNSGDENEEYAEYRIQQLPRDTFAVDQPFGLAVKRGNPNEFVLQPDFLTEDGTFYTAIRFHRRAGPVAERSDVHFIIVVPADEVKPPIFDETTDFGLEIYKPNGDLGWSSRWAQAVIKQVHPLNQGYEHTPASAWPDPSGYELEPGYDGVDTPIAFDTDGFSEAPQNLRSRGRWSRLQQPPDTITVWPWDEPVGIAKSLIYTLFSTGSGYVQYYKGMLKVDGQNAGLQGGGLHALSTRVTSGGFIIDMARMGEGPDPSSSAQWCKRATPSYHPTGNIVFLGSNYVGPVLEPDEFCVTGRKIPSRVAGIDNSYYSPLGFISSNYSEFTLAFCVLPRATGDNFMYSGSNFQVSIEANGTLQLYGLTTAVNIFTFTSSTGALTLGQWNSIYITGKVTGTSCNVIMWTNGSQVLNDTDTWNGTETFARHNRGGNMYIGDPSTGTDFDISFIWFDDTFLDPSSNYSKFFAGSVPINVGDDGSYPTGAQPLNYFPDGSMLTQKGSLTIQPGSVGAWSVGYEGWIPESVTNPTGCPQKLDGGDYGGICVTGRVFDEDETPDNYYTSSKGFINNYYEGCTFIFCMRENGVTNYGCIYDTSVTDGGSGVTPFSIGLKSTGYGDFFCDILTNGGEWLNGVGYLNLTSGWHGVYVTWNLLPATQQARFEVYVDRVQKISQTFNNVTGTAFVPHNIAGPAYINKGNPDWLDSGVNADISYIVVYDEFWYVQEYYNRFFSYHATNPTPMSLGSGHDAATGVPPVVYFPDGSPIQNVQISPSTWTVTGYIPESDTNPAGCPKKEDGGDGTPPPIVVWDATPATAVERWVGTWASSYMYFYENAGHGCVTPPWHSACGYYYPQQFTSACSYVIHEDYTPFNYLGNWPGPWFMMKYTVVSGDTNEIRIYSTETTGVEWGVPNRWYDIYRSFIGLDTSINYGNNPVLLEAVIDITIAQYQSGTYPNYVPVPGTEKTKRCTIIAESIAG